jgi:hypothetical protein
MTTLPFHSIEDAKEQAKNLCRVFAFCQIYWKPAPLTATTSTVEKISLQQTHQLIAKICRCHSWDDLCRRIELSNTSEYIDEKILKKDTVLRFANEFQRFIGDHNSIDLIVYALNYSNFACVPNQFLNRLVNSRIKSYKSAQQMWAVERIIKGFDFASRYDGLRTPHENAILRYNVEKRLAKVYGTRAPGKPRRKRVKKFD